MTIQVEIWYNGKKWLVKPRISHYTVIGIRQKIPTTCVAGMCIG